MDIIPTNEHFIVAVIGKKTEIEHIDESQEFMYQEVCFESLIDLHHKNFLRAIENVPEFKLITKEYNSCEYLILIFCPDLEQLMPVSSNYNKYVIAKNYICNIFLTKENGDLLHEKLEEKEKENESSSSISELFDRLREEHKNDILSKSVPEDVQHKFLKPMLRPYQINAVKWMLQRELVVDYLPSEYIEVFTIIEYTDFVTSESERLKFYYNKRTAHLAALMPDEIITKIPIPKGGILADEMGMGKTVEVLAVILLHKQKKRAYTEITNNIDQSIINIQVKDSSKINCICINKTDVDLIPCSNCLLYQHKNCIRKSHIESKAKYICPACWEFEPLVQSSATLIVTPFAIRSQWDCEIKKHIKGNLKVFIYDGFKGQGWISPYDLSEYDIVIVDYNILKYEINYKCAAKKSLRNISRYMRPVSPLPFINWWRVCLDEAQMVDTPTNKAAMMVKTLPAVHRWSITGTPIEKKFDNLYGFLYFLGIEPYFSDSQLWKNELLLPFLNGNFEPIITVLKKILWRTCKMHVIDQLNIPQQTEVLHIVSLSDVERLNYDSKHNECELAFNEKVTVVLKLYKTRHLDVHKLKLLMDPLRQLRQECIVSSKFNTTDALMKQKEILGPNQLLEHLIKAHEKSCKEKLRSMVSSMNGIAGLHVLKNDIPAAICMYQKVLKLSSENTGNISVDTLLQIHALYNLSQILNGCTALPEYCNLQKYRIECKSLENKYIQPHYLSVRRIDERTVKPTREIRCLQIKLLNKYWWQDLLYSTNLNLDAFFNKISTELHLRGHTISLLQTPTTYNTLLISWWDEIITTRNDYLNGFANLKYFYKRRDMTAMEHPTFSKLIESLNKCHLQRIVTTVPNTHPCEICVLKQKLEKHECVIFDKELNSGENIEGSWNPTYQESILRLLWNFAKNKNYDEAIIESCDISLKIIEEYKAVFKEYSRLWVEINYTANAYDELIMCRQRILLPDVASTYERFVPSIAFEFIDTSLEDQKLRYKFATEKMEEFSGRIKYLQHLKKSSSEIGSCPICATELTEKYCVLHCGHHMCLICLAQLSSLKTEKIACSVCRYKQKRENVNFVTCQRKINEDAELIGNFSTKIEAILKTIFKIRKQNENDKIIIFSEWDDILSEIANAIEKNNITYRHCTNLRKIDASINDFKDPKMNITCLLLRIKFGSKGLNLIEATHVFLVEPMLNLGEESQAIGRVHRIGQTKPTYVHRFIMKNTIEQNIHEVISKDLTDKWKSRYMNIDNLRELFLLKIADEN